MMIWDGLKLDIVIIMCNISIWISKYLVLVGLEEAVSVEEEDDGRMERA